MTDALGVCESWPTDGSGEVVLRRERGDVVRIPLADVVAGKPVPPRPLVHSRLDAAAADRLALPGWPALETEPLGEWLLRAASGYTKRANSVLALGEPGTDDAVDRVAGWYAARDLVPRAHVLPGSDAAVLFDAAGWVTVERTLLLLATPARVRRRLAASTGAAGPEVTVSARLDDAWLRTDERCGRYLPASRQVLEGAAPQGAVWFATVREADGSVLARGRAALHGDWLGLASLWTHPDRRGQGLGRAVVAELLEVGVQHGATTTYLQVTTDNEAARRLYGDLGYAEHHRYDYLAPAD
jgi:ribosomal protein S18 acetylase RimI-like enzyme